MQEIDTNSTQESRHILRYDTQTGEPIYDRQARPESFIADDSDRPTRVDPTKAADGVTASSKTRKSKKGGKSFVWGLLGVVVGAALMMGVNALGGSFMGGSSAAGGDTSSSNGTITITPGTTDSDLAEVVASKAMPSVVSIDVYTQTSNSFYNMFGMSSGDQESDLIESSLGSGVIIAEDGYILTNYHVVEGGAKYIVHFDDDSTEEATLVGSDSTSDLAVLKVEKTGLTPIEIGDSSTAVVGEWVMALGSPYGLTKSVSTGIVSALYRSQTLESSYGTAFYVNMIQTDASINPGNSGGALVDEQGKLLGINTMIASSSGGSTGVGFAIPVNYAMNIANQIIETGTATHPYIGVNVGTVDAGTQSYYNTTAESGAYVGSVVSGSPAEQAGVQEGDVIVSFNGEAVTTSSELIIDVRSCNVGDTVELGIVRGSEQITVNVTLASDESASNASSSSQQNQGHGFRLEQ